MPAKVTNKTLTIETWGDYAPPTCSVRIKRQADKAYFDVATSTFLPEANCKNTWVVLPPSTSPALPNLVTTDVVIDPAQWADGDYTVYFHETTTSSNRLFAISEVTIYNGDPTTQKSYSATEIAGRVWDATLSSHVSTGSVGAALNQILQQVQAIKTKVGA
jgi:hypothetical protein